MTRGPVLFFDPNNPIPYDDTTSRHRGLGGTEQMVARVASALAAERPVIVQQSAREKRTESGGVSWRPIALPLDRPPGSTRKPLTIVVVQHWKLLRAVRAAHPDARLLLWLHCFLGRKAGRRLGAELARTNARVLCVSRCHAQSVREQVTGDLPENEACRRVGFVYNAVEDDLEACKAVERDPNLLLSLSSRHKGQSQVFEAFAAVRRRIPEMRLMVADPGYFPGSTASAPGVDLRGTLDRPQTIDWLRRAHALFYPQSSFRETFGLVFAEANAVGTPVLAHPHGAAPEILEASQLVDADRTEEVVERLVAWRRDGVPAVRLRPELRLRRVVGRWREEVEGVVG